MTARCRIAVVGNCQVPSIAQILGAMLPHISVDQYPLMKFPTLPDKEKLAGVLSGYDIVLTQPLTDARHGPVRSEATRANNRHVIIFPAIVFGGFHPDFFDDASVKTFGGGAYHSKIVAAAFRSGLAARDAVALLNDYNFARLGYLKEYPEARKFLLAKAAELEFDLSPVLDGWEQSRQPFMHTPRHPVIAVLAAVSRTLAEKIGESGGADAETRDALGVQQRLPIYPFMAKRLRVSGEDTFTRYGKTTDIEQYVCGTYEHYETASPGFFEDRRIVETAELLL